MASHARGRERQAQKDWQPTGGLGARLAVCAGSGSVRRADEGSSRVRVQPGAGAAAGVRKGPLPGFLVGRLDSAGAQCGDGGLSGPAVQWWRWIRNRGPSWRLRWAGATGQLARGLHPIQGWPGRPCC